VKHVVQFSGGIGSYCAARRVVAAHPGEDVVLLFADTSMEDEDLYRFVREAVAKLAVPLVTLRDGRTPWAVFRDVRFLGNTRVDPCSRVLKREPLDRWMRANCNPAATVRYVGIDWTEEHRYRRIAERLAGWRVQAPMCEPPYLSRRQMMDQARADGIEPPRLYALGFQHNNCGGFCVKAGQAAFRRLLETMPLRYAGHEAQEEAMRSLLAADVAIMRDRTGGTTRPLTMREFRERVEAGVETDRLDWGACSCFEEPRAAAEGKP